MPKKEMLKNKNPNPKPKPTQQRPILPWKTRITLFFLNLVTGVARRADGTVNRLIFHVLDYVGLRTPPNPSRSRRVRTSDITIDPSRDLWFRLFVPNDSRASESPVPVVVFFHGGGFVYLSPDFMAYDNVCRRFARHVQAVVVSVNYRLAPEHRYPAQHNDGFDVLGFLDDQVDLLPSNADLSRCFLAGDSAGGNIAHHVAARACDSKFNRLKVIGMVNIQPFFGGQGRTESEVELEGVDAIVSITKTDWMWNAVMPPGSGMDRDHEMINVSGPRAADISKLDFPPTMVVVAGFDPLKDWQMRYYEWLVKSGKEAYLVEYPNMFHAFYIFPELPESGQLISSIKQFIHSQCSKYAPIRLMCAFWLDDLG